MSNLRAHLGFYLILLAATWLFGSALYAEEDFESEFMAWAEEFGLLPASLSAIGQDGNLLLAAGFANAIDLPRPIASISKTIAGQCAVHMARQEVLSLKSTTSDFLDWDGPQGDVTVAQLLTHSSGFGPDSTQRDILGRNLNNYARIQAVIDDVSTRQMLSSDAGSYSYNNENFLVLEALMTAAANEDAVSWCKRSVPGLNLLETLARADQAEALGFAGGLSISAQDLALFFHGLTVDDDWPRVLIAGSNEYGPGVIMQTTSVGQNIFHVGGICVALGPKFGAFAAQLTSGNSVAALYSGCADENALGRLNELVLRHLGEP